MPLFCRHNRLTANCPICSRELAAERQAAHARAARPHALRARSRASTQRRAPGVVTKRVARAADDGYRNPLVPGLRATADAERLAAALAWADARLEPPGPHPAVAEEPDQEEAFWLAFLLALVPPGARELHEAIVASRPSWASGEAPDIPGADPRTMPAYRAWAERAGTQAEAFLGEPGVDARAALRPHLRAARAARPGARRALRAAEHARRRRRLRRRRRRAARRQDRRRDHARRQAPARLGRRDAARAPRRRPRAGGCGVRIGALDRALAVWGEGEAPEAEAPPALRAALGLS